jgi:hypothetical protein
MRFRDTFASLLGLLFPVMIILAPGRIPARSQPDRSAINRDGSEPAELEIGGITVRLGMGQEQTLSKFSGMSYKLEQPEPDNWVLSSGGIRGQVIFRSGVLVFASRDWLTRSDEELESVSAALVSLTQRGGPSCTLSSHPFSAPATNVQWVHISCGKRTLKLGVGRAQGSPVRSLTESIGSP